MNDGLAIQTVFIGEGASTINLQVFARIGQRRFEFVRLAGAQQLEVYDYPKAWRGLARFCGYAPAASADKLYTLAQEAAVRAVCCDWHGKTIEISK